MFSDESHFELHLTEKFSRCRRPLGLDRFSPRLMLKTVKHPLKVRVRGASAGKSRGGARVSQQGGNDEWPAVSEAAG
jgi:hypothetical protein